MKKSSVILSGLTSSLLLAATAAADEPSAPSVVVRAFIAVQAHALTPAESAARQLARRILALLPDDESREPGLTTSQLAKKFRIKDTTRIHASIMYLKSTKQVVEKNGVYVRPIDILD